MSSRKRSRSISLVLLPPVLALSMLPILSGCGKDPDQDDSNNAEISSDSAEIANLRSRLDVPPAPVVGDVYQSANDCKTARTDPNDPNSPLLNDPAECDRAATTALTQHVQNAPKFNTLAECEAQFGPQACGPTPVVPVVPVVQADELVITAPQPQTTVVVREQSSGFMPFMVGYMLGSMNSGHYYSTPVYYPAYSWRSSDYSRALVPSGGYGYTTASAARPIGYVARNTTALTPVGLGRATVVAPTASGAPPPVANFKSAVAARSPSFGTSVGTSRSSSFGSTVASSSRGGFGMSASGHASSSSGG